MSQFQEKQKRQMTGIRLDEAENQPKRRNEGSKPPTRPASHSHQQRPASAIMASIMGDQQSRANSTGGDGRRSESATSGGRQHKLKQRFTVIRKLGKGTYGKVQLAINKETGQEVAIKTIKKTKIENEQDLERVRREIQIMSSIEHPHIVHIYEVFENKDKIVLIMQYAPGGELYEYVSQSKVLDEHEARRLFRQIATAIYYCHQNKICHRDLKLENILLDEKNNAKLADFGLSNVFDKSRQLKTFCGSPLYASPEIVQGSPYEGPEVDCWSLGVLLYTLVYGAMPFDGSNFKRLVKQISEASYYEPAKRSLASPLISKLLCADPTKRATILDICSDSWVNGPFAPATPTHQSPRLSPSGGSQHPSLLKVAQDMANLTPVRLDILLALTPRTNETAAIEQHNSSANKLADTNQRQIIQPAREQADKKEEKEQQKQQQVQERQEQERVAMMSQLGSELMEAADEMRSSSPVASYMVRDLSPTTTNPPNLPDQQAVPSNRQEVDQTNSTQSHGDNKPTIEEEIEQLEAVTSLQPHGSSDQQDVTMTTKDETPHEDLQQQFAEQVEPTSVDMSTQPAEPEVVVDQLEKVTTGEPPLNELTPEAVNGPDDARDSVMEVDSEAQAKVGESAPQEAAPQEEAPEALKSISETEASQEKTIENSEKQVTEKDEKEEKTVGGSEEKPKKVKKRIVVVKKRRKVVKKDENNQEGEAKEDGEQTGVGPNKLKDAPIDGEGSTPGKKTSPSRSTSISGGPGKVRIPETFDQSTQSAAAVQTQRQPKQTATRRPSALITDVSQKLMQQAECTTISANAIEQDLAQLASVKVSDKKSEFERRTSLAAAQQSTVVVAPSGSSQNRDSTQHGPALQQTVDPPECCEAKHEQIKVAQLETPGVVEQVERLQPLGFDQLQVVTRGQGSEPLTPTNLRRPSLSAEQEAETAKRLHECAQRLSADRTEGERSDSVETIKGEGEISGEELPPDAKKNIRTSLQIDLSGAQAAAAADTRCQDSGPMTFQSTGGGSIGPAPIARSYKKVTFTKDGTCITETGRIYSTQADDGTMRRVERKSKVTHYPSDDVAAGSHASTREETATHEEIVYESSMGGGQESGFWPRRSSSNSRPAPLERLIMPSSSFYESDDGPARPEEFMYKARPAGHSQSHFGQQPPPPMERADSASSCSSGSTDVFDDIFDTWTGAISMFGQRRHHRPHHLSDVRNSLMNRAFVTGSPLPFGRQHSNLTRRDLSNSRHRDRPQSSSGANHPTVSSFFVQQPGSAATTMGQHCESAEPNFSQQHTSARRHPRHRRGQDRPPSADGGSGYESDVLDEPTAFERRSLGSARGRFGSSNLFPRHAPESAHQPGFLQDPFAAMEQELAADPGASLFEQMALEHERLRRKFAQQRMQMWKGSTPALNEIPEFRSDPVRQQQQQQQLRQHSSSSRSGSGSHWSTRSTSERPQQQQPVKRTSVVFQMSGGGSGSSLGQLRQSTPLDATPVRRNTANLPPAAPGIQLVRRSTSKTSFITSHLANIQLDEPANSQQQQQQRSASFLGLKRDTTGSGSSLAQQPPVNQRPIDAQLQQQQRQQPGSAVSSATATFWTDERNTPTLDSSGTTAGQSAALQRPAHDLAAQDAEANSRIQSWLLQSAGNLSISSGSKSSASDATLPSSGRSDTAAYLASPSSAAQMVPLRRDESTRTTTTSSLSIDPHQRTQSTLQSRIILAGHQLPPAAPSRSRDKSPQFPQMVPSRPVTSSTIIVRSSSKQSLLAEQPDGGRLAGQSHQVVTQANEVTETIVSTDGSQQRQQAAIRQRTAVTSSSSAAVSSQKMFAFPSEGATESRHETVTSTRQQVFSQRAMSPVITTISSGGPTQESWFTSGGQVQRIADDDGFDSLGDLESVCSSSLLEQLRARGYRSMINQRMTPVADAVSQQAATVVATTSEQSTSNVVTTSSTSMTMSSSSETPQIRHHRVVQEQQQQNLSQQQAAAEPVVAHDQRFLPMNGVAQREEPAPVHIVPTDKAEGNTVLQTPEQSLQEQPEPPLATMPAQPSGKNEAQPVNEHQNNNNNNNNNNKLVNESAPEIEEDQDEDVREAKANIKEYLERMRETEKFLKSMHEEEEKFQRQRQELLLFDNLLLSTKLNGIRPSLAGGGCMNSLDCNNNNNLMGLSGGYTLGGSARAGPHSAPIQTNHMHSESLQSNGFMKNITAGLESPQTLSCFSSDLYRPMASSFAATSLMGGGGGGGTARTSGSAGCDPLEPVQPVSMHAYAPPSRNWQRSKSQLGDQFTSYRSSRRPMSANLDASATGGGGGGNAYFPSRQRRSISQIRYPHHHQNPSVLATSGMNQYHGGGDHSPPSMTSEYKSSFGAASLAPDLSHRPSRSPRRATSPLPSAATYGARRGTTAAKVDNSDDDDEEDLGMGAYRASSYVPRTLTEVGVSGGRDLGSSRPRSYGSWRNRDTIDDRVTTTTDSKSPSRLRRSSVQATSYVKYDTRKQDTGGDSDTPESSPTRRKSWATSNDSSAAPGGQTNSRLSELEQRIQANKKRREELLMGINQSAPAPQPVAARARRTSGNVSSDDDGDDMDQSFGFERPSRPSAARVDGEGSELNGALCERAEGKQQRTTRAQPATAATRARPSRLESMEARIKRRSYCIRLTSPDRSARSRVVGSSGASGTGNKCQTDQKTDVERERERE